MGRHVYVKAGHLGGRGRNLNRPRKVVPIPIATEAELTPYGDYLRDEWLPALKVEVEPTTYNTTRDHVEHYIEPWLGEIPVSAITQRMLKEFYQELLKTHWMRSETRLLSKGTVNRIHRAVSWSLQSLVEAGRLPANPAWAACPRITKSERYEPVTWTPEQLRDFLEFTKDDGLATLWNMLALTGMRRGEAIGLRWFDLSHRYTHVAIRRSVVEVAGRTYVTGTKSSKGRRVDLLRATAISLRAHRTKEMRRRRRAKVAPLRPNDFIFCKSDGSHLGPSSITKRFQKLGRDGGFTRIRLHDLRHTHASHLLQAGANLKAVQERLGHADPLFTIDTYVHMMPTIQAEAVKALTKFYGTTGAFSGTHA